MGWCVLLAIPTRAFAVDYYVSPTGNDNAGSGQSAGAPFATIKKAIALIKPGDTIHLAAGVYREAVVLHGANSGTANQRINIVGAGMGATMLDGSDPLPNTGWANCGNGVYRLPLAPTFITAPIYRFEDIVAVPYYCATALPEFAAPQHQKDLPANDERVHDPTYACRTDAVWQIADPSGLAVDAQRLRWAPHPLGNQNAPLPVGSYFVSTYDTTGKPWHPTLLQKITRDAQLCSNPAPSNPAYNKQQTYLYVRPFPTAVTNLAAPPPLAMTTAARATPFNTEADYGILRDLTVRRASSGFQVGAINVVGNDWTFDHIEVRDNALEGWQANRIGWEIDHWGNWFKGIEIRHSKFLENGMLGIAGGYLSDGTIENNEVANNNWQQWSIGDAGAGAKFPGPERMMFRNNFFHHNYGPGLWFDTFGSHTQILDNIFFGNYARQLHLELVGPSKDVCADGCCVDTACTGPECEIRVEGNVFAGNYYTGAASEPEGGVLIRSARMTNLQNNLFVGNNNALTYQASTSTCFRLGGNHASHNQFADSSHFHLLNGSSNFSDQPHEQWCVENSLAGERDGASCPALATTSMWAAICDPPRTDCNQPGQQQYATTSWCTTHGCLIREASCYDDPAPYNNPALTNDFDENLYTTKTVTADLTALFDDLPALTSDVNWNENPAHDWIYSWSGNTDPAYPELNHRWWNYAAVIGARTKAQQGFLGTGFFFDRKATYQAPGAMVHHAHLPFTYTAPPTTADVTLGQLHIFRLGAGGGSVPIKIMASAVNGAVPNGVIQVRLNGRPLTNASATATLLASTTTLSPWENWFSVSMPANTRLISVAVGGSGATCPITPPKNMDTTCDGIDDDCDGAIDDDYQPTSTNCGVGSCAASGMSTCNSGKIITQCAPLAPTLEKCGDGVDQDCNGSDLSCAVPATPLPTVVGQPTPAPSASASVPTNVSPTPITITPTPSSTITTAHASPTPSLTIAPLGITLPTPVSGGTVQFGVELATPTHTNAPIVGNVASGATTDGAATSSNGCSLIFE